MALPWLADHRSLVPGPVSRGLPTVRWALAAARHHARAVRGSREHFFRTDVVAYEPIGCGPPSRRFECAPVSARSSPCRPTNRRGASPARRSRPLHAVEDGLPGRRAVYLRWSAGPRNLAQVSGEEIRLVAWPRGASSSVTPFTGPEPRASRPGDGARLLAEIGAACRYPGPAFPLRHMPPPRADCLLPIRWVDNTCPWSARPARSGRSVGGSLLPLSIGRLRRFGGGPAERPFTAMFHGHKQTQRRSRRGVWGDYRPRGVGRNGEVVPRGSCRNCGMGPHGASKSSDRERLLPRPALADRRRLGSTNKPPTAPPPPGGGWLLGLLISSSETPTQSSFGMTS